MIRDQSPAQPGLFAPEDFHTPFGAGLDPDNRWIRWARQIPWNELASIYHESLKCGGRPAKPARLVIGALIVKHRLGLSDTETIEQLRENPYLQYFCGFERYRFEAAFAPALFVKLRERLSPARFAAFEQAVIDRMAEVERASAPCGGDDDEGGGPPQGSSELPTGSESSHADEGEVPQGKGTLIIDASVAEQKIRYPNDVSLLEEARRNGEALIDHLWSEFKAQGLSAGRKPRTYRAKARRESVAYSKKRRPGGHARRRARRRQLQYLRRNLATIDTLLDDWQAALASLALPLSQRQLRRLCVVREVYRQQDWLHRNKAKRIHDRLVSLGQPHVRPLVRGRAGRPVEFGAKFSVALTAGVACVDRLRWDAFSEAHDLIGQCQAYRQRHGHYPGKVLADGAYGTRANRRWMQANGIAFGGKPLGRPPNLSAGQQRAIDRQRAADARQRIPIEGKFGQGKGGYGLDKIAARRADTSEAWIRMIFLVMNLIVLAKVLFWPRFRRLYPPLVSLWASMIAINARSIEGIDKYRCRQHYCASPQRPTGIIFE